MESGNGKFVTFIKQQSLKSIFGGRKRAEEESVTSQKWISELSPIANSVASRCSGILRIPTEELQHRFEIEMPDHAKEPSIYAANLLEYCSYHALYVATQRPDHLGDKNFRRLTYDMMLAWEAPGVEGESLLKEATNQNSPAVEDEDGGSLFYLNSTRMAVQVDDKKTVGPAAFARIAPACPAIADIITVHNLFEALTCSSSGRLHFLIYDKYLGCLDKVIKAAKSLSGLHQPSSLQLAEGEIILDIDGGIPTQPVLQHIGISMWPGRLTLTNRALYFESLGVGSYNKAVRYDLSADLKQVVKPELTGPLGARLFDKAVMYKSASVTEPVYIEFPEFKGHSRRDYWLAVIREILHVHRFIRKFNFEEIMRAEALSRAILGIFRFHALREAFHIVPSHFKTPLAFNLAEKLPGGDKVLEALASRLELLNTKPRRHDSARTSSGVVKLQSGLHPVSLWTLNILGFGLLKKADATEDAAFLVGDVLVGEKNPLELAVNQTKCDSGKAEAAWATVDQVKVEGIDTNLALMKELLFPVVEISNRVHFLASWDDPFRSTMFLMLTCYAIYRCWIKYILPCIFVFLASLMLWHKHCREGKPLEVLAVTPPPARNPVEQLITLQEAISQFEMLFQAANIILLKLRSLLFAAVPQATDRVAVFLVAMAAVFAFVPLKYLIMLIFLEAFTREMPLRKETSNKLLRRLREWWFRIPAAPVQLAKPEEIKKKK